MSSPVPDLKGRLGLLSRLQADQSVRWGRGERVPLEDYVQQYAELASDPEALLALLCAEVLLRRENGDTPDVDEYLARFPQHADRIRQLWGAHDFIVRQVPHGPGTTGSDRLTEPVTAGRRDRPLPTLPGYEVLTELGKGGMGVVYKARQIAFDRLVAIKMIRSQVIAGPEELARFRTEALAVGRLDHPHVVRVFAFGEEQDCPYFVMEYLSGGSLAGLLREGPLKVRQAVELVRQVALGVQAAHQAGILHRDLKPANVLLDAEGNARVADFGLAKLLDADGGQTASAMLLGTPAYMAPEQAEGKTRDVSCAVDVWALGVSLYECLTGHPPFKGTTRSETLERVKNQSPLPPRKLQAAVPAELERVCLKCLEKDPTRRYRSAAALADELERWLQGRAVAVQAPSWPIRAWLFARTHRWSSLVVLVVFLALAGWFVQSRRPKPQQPREVLEATLAAGQPYEFDAARGLPGPFRWVIGDGVWLRANAAGDGFSCGTLETGLLELVVPPCDRYLFSAEVRHDDQGGLSHLGLYVGYREQRTASGDPQSGFFTFSFADRGPLAENLRGKDGKPASIAILRASLFERRKGMEWVPRLAIGARQLFEPALPQGRPGPWRELAVKVTPEGVEGFWPDNLGRRSRFTKISARELQQAIEALKRSEPGMAGIPARFEPRSGLGLFVYRGQGSFRRVRLEPLPATGP